MEQRAEEKKAVIDLITREVMKRMSPALSTEDPRKTQHGKRSDVLVVLDRVDHRLLDILEALVTYTQKQEQPCAVHGLLSEDVRLYCDGEGLDVTKVFAETYTPASLSQVLGRMYVYKTLILGTVSFALINRVSAMEDDDPFANVVIRALLENVKTTALVDAISPEGVKKVETSYPHSYNKPLMPQNDEPSELPRALQTKIDEALTKLAQFNISLATIQDLKQDIAQRRSSSKKSLITEKDLVELKVKGVTELNLLKGSIITPLALDKAKDLGITIIRR